MRNLVFVCALGAALALAGSAGATPPAAVTIEVHTVFADGFGTFTAAGGGLCPSGTMTEVGVTSANGSPKRIVFHSQQTFTCADGSGSFTLHVLTQFVFGATTESLNWKVQSGTGAYANLRGNGTATATVSPSTSDTAYLGAVS